MRVDAIVCADHHADTIYEVARVAACAPQIGQTLIVDAGSEDGTADRAEQVPGARVIRVEAGHRRGDYELIGIEASDADCVVFLDPDLVGLTQAHLDALAWSVREGNCGMACGLFDRGPFINQVFLRMLPIVDTQRAVSRHVLDALDPDDVAQFCLEPTLNALCAGLRVPTHSIGLPGLRYAVNAARGRPPLGLIREHVALTKQFWSYASYMLSHRLPATTPEAIESTDEAAA